MKKILLVSPLPPPVGGIASWTVNMLKYFRTYSNEEYSLEHLNNAMQLRSITSTSRVFRVFYGIINFVSFYFRLIGKIFKRPDLCHFTSSASLGLFKDIFFILTCRLFRIDTVIHYRFGRIPELYTNKGWEWRVLKFVNSISTFVIVLDNKSLETLNKYHKHVFLIENPVSPQLIEVKNRIIKSPENTILFVGHVTRKKGIYEFFEATSDLDIKYKLEIIGPFEKDVKQDLLNRYSNKEREVIFHGPLNNESVYGKMINSKLLILPSYTEGFPNVIIEGMALGCAIIATDVGAIPDMLSEDRGMLISPQNVFELNEVIKILLSNDTLRDTFCINAESYALKNYTIQNIVKKLEFIWTYGNKK